MRKTVFITGGSRGIGAAAVEQFSAAGWDTAFCWHSSERQADEVARRTGALSIRADVADPAAVRETMERAEQALGRIDVLVNNAGLDQFGLLTDLSDAEWSRLLDVNLSSVFYTSRAVLPGMIRRKSGCILNISSIWGICGGSCEAAYSAAKAGVIGLTKALAKEVGPCGIRVNCVAPGAVDTDMNQRLSQEERAALKEETPLLRLGTPEEIASLLVFLAGEQASFITGQVISPNGGLVI